MVQRGVEQAYGPSFRQLMRRSQAKLSATVFGALLAAIMQSSLAVAIMMSGLFGSSMISFELGLAAILGADLGSALVILFLSLDIHWLAPLMLLVGGLLFLKSETPTLKHARRQCDPTDRQGLSRLFAQICPCDWSGFCPPRIPGSTEFHRGPQRTIHHQGLAVGDCHHRALHGSRYTRGRRGVHDHSRHPHGWAVLCGRGDCLAARSPRRS